MTVAVLRGGPSGEYEVSLQTGSTVLRNLPERYKPLDIFISKSGAWHRGGISMKPADALRHVDVVFNALHGEYGEDGKVQRLLEQLGMPYTGSDAIGSALGMQKPRAKEYFAKAGLKTAKHWLLSVTDNLKEKLLTIFRSFPLPFVVKPVAAGSSLGVSVAYSFPDLEAAVAKAFGYGPEVLIEEFVRGREATCGVVEGFRGTDLYPLFPVEIIPESGFFDYDAKYRGRSQELCPSTFSPYEKRQIEKAAMLAH